MTTQQPPDRRPADRPDPAQGAPDANAEPLPTSSAQYMAAHGTPLVDAAPPVSAPADDTPHGGADAAFLIKGFGIPPHRAARLLDSSDAAATEAEARRLLAADDPLAGVPTPSEPASDRTADSDEERLKPVLHRARYV